MNKPFTLLCLGFANTVLLAQLRPANANAPVTGRARAEITGGGAAGVQATVRMSARRGMILSIVPNDAMVYVNDLLIGQANQFDKPDEVYDFAAPGSYTIRISAPGYRDRQFVVNVAANATPEVARIEATLAPDAQQQR